MKIEKSGCILVNTKTKKIGLIYRNQYDDYSFPKGHVESGESLLECAIRETEEETKRRVKIYPYEDIIDYYHESNDDIYVHYYIGIDDGVSDNDSLDTHELVWVDYDSVINLLTYDSSKETWNLVKDVVLNIMNKIE